MSSDNINREDVQRTLRVMRDTGFNNAANALEQLANGNFHPGHLTALRQASESFKWPRVPAQVMREFLGESDQDTVEPEVRRRLNGTPPPPVQEETIEQLFLRFMEHVTVAASLVANGSCQVGNAERAKQALAQARAVPFDRHRLPQLERMVAGGRKMLPEAAANALEKYGVLQGVFDAARAASSPGKAYALLTGVHDRLTPLIKKAEEREHREEKARDVATAVNNFLSVLSQGKVKAATNIRNGLLSDADMQVGVAYFLTTPQARALIGEVLDGLNPPEALQMFQLWLDEQLEAVPRKK